MEPYLSIVLVARNDNYGGDFNERLHNCVHWLARFIEANRLPAELLLVDYNPIAANAPLLATLRLPEQRSHLHIRALHVPGEIHQRLVCPAIRKTVPFFEFIAKNIAVRRAKGEYILCTNADILFHPSIFDFITKRLLEKQHYYRADRYDYKKVDTYNFEHPYVTLHTIQQRVFRMMLKGYAYEVKGGQNYFEESHIRLENSWRLFLDLHPEMAERWRMNTNYEGFIMRYHTHCSGDFMLMHRDSWFSLRGYPEDTYISTHCDALLTVMAGVSGLQETVLQWPVYHQDHERRYNTDMDESKANADISRMFTRFLADTREMAATGTPKIVNTPDWGLAGEQFAETVL